MYCEILRVLPIAREIFLIRADQPRWRFAQPVPVGVLPDPAQNQPKRLFGIVLRQGFIVRA